MKKKTRMSNLLCNSIPMIRKVIRIKRGRLTALRILTVVVSTLPFRRQKRSNCNRIKTPKEPIVEVFAPHMIRPQMTSKLECPRPLSTVKKIILRTSIRNKKLSSRLHALYKTRDLVQKIINSQTSSSPCQ